tara:strand:+ start:1031 stop:1225 length:195 start_codon:yes stop_codon:yes gene_type:complete
MLAIIQAIVTDKYSFNRKHMHTNIDAERRAMHSITAFAIGVSARSTSPEVKVHVGLNFVVVLNS